MKLTGQQFRDLIKKGNVTIDYEHSILKKAGNPVAALLPEEPELQPEVEASVPKQPEFQLLDGPSRSSSIQQLWEAYKATNSVHRAAELVNLKDCGETVRKRLTAAGYRLNHVRWTKNELNILRRYYETTKRDKFSITDLEAQLKRSWVAIALKASRLGLGDWNRPYSEEHLEKMRQEELSKPTPEERAIATGKRVSELWKTRGHPKGMLGKHHTQAVKDAQSARTRGKPLSEETLRKMMETRKKNGTEFHINPRPFSSWKAGWREVGGKRLYARSRWEANYARYLQWQIQHGLIKSWEHEPKTFWFDGIKRGCCSYLPDFRVILMDGKEEYHEVKGWMDDRSKTKIKRMASHYPEVVLKIINKAWFAAMNYKCSCMIKDWEKDR